MVNFQLRLYNFPAERLFKPRKRLAPNLVPKAIVDLLPFSEEDLNDISEESDVIQFIEYFAFDLGFDNIQDFSEYINTNEFYLIVKASLPEHQILLGNALK